MATLTAGSGSIDMLQTQFAFTDQYAIITGATTYSLTVRAPSGNTQTLSGFFMYSGGSILPGSSISGFTEYSGGSLLYDITGFYLPVESWAVYVVNSNAAGMRGAIFAGSDTLNGSSGNDRLMGFGGNDTINGGSGYDTAVYRGNLSDYTITKANGQVTVTDLRGIDGSDTLSNIEALQFANTTIALNSPTVVTGSNYTPGRRETAVSLSSLVTFFDADGDALQQIEIFDNTAGGGRFRGYGVMQPEKQGISLAPADFANYEFVTDGAATDSISFRAFDGTSWGAWTTFNVYPRANALPAITAPNLAPGKTDTFIAGANLFSVSDADGDAITRYKFYDGTAGNGRFVLNGAAQTELANIEIAAADLTNFGFETSPAGPSTLWVQAYDGSAWGAWKSFAVAAVANAAPIASVQNLAPAKGTAFIAASALVTVSDPDDAAVVRYRFFDGTQGNGRFQLNGADLAELQNITVEAADFANFRFRTATSGNDVLWVQAFDGTSWSTWKSFTVAAPSNVAPTVNVQNLAPTRDQAFIAGSSLFTVTDPDDAGAVKYRFFDGTSGNGRFQLRGFDQVELANIEIDASELADFRYATSTSGQGDTLWVQAYDGVVWSAWKSFTAASRANALPVVSVADHAPAHGSTTVTASSLFFAVSDADGDSIAAYRFFDGTVGGGHFRKNGVDQPELANITVSAMEMVTTDFVLGSGSDVIWVQAYDETARGAWKSFTLLPTPNSAPVITVNMAMLAPSKGVTTVAVSSLFSTSDADGDTITHFRFFDGTSGNGRFETSMGSPLGERQNVIISASDLANINYRTSTTGNGDTLWVQAYDGTTWGAWKSFDIAAPTNVAPVVNVQTIVPAKTDTFLAASSLFTVTDPDDATMSKYRFFDQTIGDGRFRLNGAPQAELVNIEINASDLANLRFDTSTTGMGDMVWVQAYDGSAWSEWKSSAVLAPFNAPPVVTVQNLTPTANQSFIAANALFNVSDTDDAAMVRYRFFDGTAGNGRFQLSGVDQAELQNITVEAADLANFRYATSTAGGDTLWVQAFDGQAWSTWKSFDVAAATPGSGGTGGIGGSTWGGGFQVVMIDMTTSYSDSPESGWFQIAGIDAPVVSATNKSIAPGTVTSVAPLLSATDPGGDAITAWQLWDASTGGGTFRIGGVTQPEHQAIEVMANQLASVEFLAGNAAGSDTLWARASDGAGWGEWKSFTITTLAPV
jgi:hypothetical protein